MRRQTLLSFSSLPTDTISSPYAPLPSLVAPRLCASPSPVATPTRWPSSLVLPLPGPPPPRFLPVDRSSYPASSSTWPPPQLLCLDPLSVPPGRRSHYRLALPVAGAPRAISSTSTAFTRSGSPTNHPLHHGAGCPSTAALSFGHFRLPPPHRLPLCSNLLHPAPPLLFSGSSSTLATFPPAPPDPAPPLSLLSLPAEPPLFPA